jgi:pyruvate formate lyase activating enzyme
MSAEGIISKVDEQAVHDGPGHRALVFVKGCNLDCEWCQNPELKAFEPGLWIHKVRCIGCGVCLSVCPVNAVNLSPEGFIYKIDRDKCLGLECSKCLVDCGGGLEMVGFKITAEDLFKWLAKFRPYYEGTEGGVTLTGGDPLHSPEFSSEVLERCQRDGIHTAIETSLHAPSEDLWKVAKYCDLIMFDIKHMDPEKHKKGTGVDNELILENARRINKDFKGEMAVRIALIPGFNDDEENVHNTAKFISELSNIKGIDLLPFNPLPVAKFEALGIDWVYKSATRQPDQYVEKLCEIVKSHGIKHCTAGGLW